MTHSCIKCKKQYQSADPDPYFCETCLKTRKQIAAEIDAKMALLPKKEVKSDLQIYDEALKAGNTRFPNAKSLGFFI